MRTSQVGNSGLLLVNTLDPIELYKRSSRHSPWSTTRRPCLSSYISPATTKVQPNRNTLPIWTMACSYSSTYEVFVCKVSLLDPVRLCKAIVIGIIIGMGYHDCGDGVRRKSCRPCDPSLWPQPFCCTLRPRSIRAPFLFILLNSFLLDCPLIRKRNLRG